MSENEVKPPEEAEIVEAQGAAPEGLPAPSPEACAAAEELLKQHETPGRFDLPAFVPEEPPASEEASALPVRAEETAEQASGSPEPAPAASDSGSDSESRLETPPVAEAQMRDSVPVPESPESWEDASEPAEAEDEAVESAAAEARPVSTDGLKPRVEALLFASSTPLKLSDFCRLLERPKTAVKRALDELVAEFNQRDGALAVSRQPTGYSIVLKTDYQEIAALLMPPELEPVLLKTLSIVAIHQPLTQSRLVELRGSSAYEHIKALLEKGMVKRKREGNTYILRTTKLFATRFRLEDDPERIREAMQMFEQRAAELAAAGAALPPVEPPSQEAPAQDEAAGA